MTRKEMYVSDIHLGSVQADPAGLLQVLKKEKPNDLYIVGDLFDVWNDREESGFSSLETALFEWILENVDYTSICWGNHDEILSRFKFLRNEKFIIKSSYINFMSGILIEHGHLYDRKNGRSWLHKTSSFLYNRLSSFHQFNWLKPMIKRWWMPTFVDQMIEGAKKQGCNTVICGHTHDPAIFSKNEILYINCGDFIEHKTYVVREEGGPFLLKFADFS